jgi:hypothetical protein
MFTNNIILYMGLNPLLVYCERQVHNMFKPAFRTFLKRVLACYT